MADVFGEVADSYSTARPGYPADLAQAILTYHGRRPELLVEVGAGTGLATELLVGLAARTTCVEPDARMAEVLAARFPQIDVVVSPFERWAPPAAGVPVLACAMAWHWLDPAGRNRLAHDALAPGGTLAVFAHRYDYVDPAQSAAIRAAIESVDPARHVDAPEDWFHVDVRGSGLFADVRSLAFRRAVPLSTAAYQRLMATFSPQLRRPGELRERVQEAIGATVDGFGGTVTLDLRTTLVLARRPG
ncbi:class I SAM-dependent methyltransferase [Micromonospora sp. NPDC000089]|uniref:class I SAM-dependent methyltransferase n=1 Tax=unclassified Micromonospora TaxID=2617518 RepID=UPI0036A46A42